MNCGRNPTARYRKLSRGEAKTEKGRTEENPSLIEGRRIPVLRGDQKVPGIGNRLIHQEGDYEDWFGQCGYRKVTCGLTPCFSSRPGILDLYDG